MSQTNGLPTPTERRDIVLLMLAGELRCATDIIARLPDKLQVARNVGDLNITDIELAKIRSLVTETAAKALAIANAFTDLKP